MTDIEINPGFKETPLARDRRFDDQDFRRYRMKWNNYPKYNIVDSMPIHLDLEVTARCQLKCPGCPSMKLDFDKGDMGIEMAKKAVFDFCGKPYMEWPSGAESIKFNWRGEPTLYKKLPELVKYAREPPGVVDAMINTNGMSLTPELSEELVKAGITMVAFSIDSISPERYELLRPGAKFEKVLHHLYRFCEEAEKQDYLAIRVQRIEYPDESMPHEEFVEFFKDGFPRVNYVASNHYKEKELAGDISRESKPCAQLWQRMTITYDGWMGPCCEFNRFGEHRFGRFPDARIDYTWNGLEINELRRLHGLGKQNDVNACARCTVTKPMVRH